jgi:hypothetical protein
MHTVRSFRVYGVLAVGLVTTATASEAFAQGDSYADREQIELSVGGGVQGFTDSDLDDSVNTGGSWDVRARFGTRSALSLEAAYIGSAQDVDIIGVESDAVLVGNGAEAALRFNLITDMPWQPYVFGGAAWRRYDLTETDRNTSIIEGTDDVFEVPMGGGVEWYFDRLTLDARAQFRPAFDDDLTRRMRPDGEDDDAHRWGVSANLGYEF